MATQDTATSFGSVSRFNHWLAAVIIITMLAIGLYFEDLPRGEEKLFWLKLHISIGATALLFLAFRVYYRAKHRYPDPFPQTRPLQVLTHAVHGLLLLGIAILIITGPLTVWSGGRGIEFFGLFAIPSPVSEMKTLHETLGEIHAFAANTTLLMIVIHVVGTIKHLVQERQQFLGRMIGRRKD